MNLDDRIQEVQQKFDKTQAEHDEHTKQADLRLEEMHRLQGEFRALNSLKDEEARPSDKANTITAIPAKEEK